MPAHTTRDKLADKLADLTDRLARADEFFAKNDEESHTQWKAAVKRADDLSRDLGRLTDQAREMGLFWNGLILIPWDVAYPQVIQDAAKALQGRIIEPLTPPAQPAGGSFSGTITEDWSDIG